MSMDEDEQQEYECLLLEGYAPDEARRLARSANDKLNSRRLSGPTTGDTKNGHGSRPFITDHRLAEFDQYGISLGCDTRTPSDQESDWLANDWAAGIILDIQGVLTEKQYLFLQHKFGLDGIEPAQSVAELADRLGVAVGTAATMMPPIRRRIMKKLGENFGYAA